MFSNRIPLVRWGFLAALAWTSASAEVVDYHLSIGEKQVNFTGRPRTALAVNGSIPAPTLTFREGDLARIHVTNTLKTDTSIHWHGMLLPNRMDGVPFITFPPIKPGETFHYEFRLRQHGTFWYHSHTALQLQKGIYGALVILPRQGGTRGRTVVLSDWTDQSAHDVLRWLKRGSEWPALQRGNAQSVLGALKAGKLGSFWKRELLRMPPMDLADVAYDRFLANGEPEHHISARPGETLRLRIVDGSASTFYHLQFAGGPMTVIAADGKEVRPLKQDRLLITVAETYDVRVTPPGPGAYEMRATAHDGSAWASIWIGQGERHHAPKVPRSNLYNAMGKLKLSNVFALTPGGTMGMSDRKVNAGKLDHPGMMGGTMTMAEMMGGSGGKMKHDMPMNHGMSGQGGMPATDERDGSVHSGKGYTWNFIPLGPDVASRQPLAMDGMGPRPWPPYEKLRSTTKTALPPSRPLREVRLTLDGDMERYVWALNNKPLFSSDSIKIHRGETVRFIMINRTMMHHPMHLHGHFFRVINGQGDFSPLKHTVDVPPMQTTVIEFAAEEFGDWFFHCHLLYHLEGGMARVVHYQGFYPAPDTAPLRHQLYDDPFFFWGTADGLSNMTQGYLQLSNTRNIFNFEWEAGWAQVPGTEWETTALYQRYFNRFFRAIAGLNTEGDITGDSFDVDVHSNRGVFGLMYRLPLNLWLTAWADTDGGARFKIGRSLMLTPRLALGGEVEYDTHDRWEGRVNLAYTLSRSTSVIGQWHSDYGWGVGIRVRF
ncbi:MAG: multicopper oxidase domain-containing protein [Prosthecobacter sp.]|jgi:CopA family copper-resistance protein|uniref:multicopper oxidase family protein n=1 Tax=Prosthecobacter sp. TaxID=1965333 RepID=UPI0019FB7066|nr:multicopper oxidase family protein [Prosthecobacter sp.]MBE2285110.1 multicopper oxidase domain-containing protein [Prosthecobacter sp.]